MNHSRLTLRKGFRRSRLFCCVTTPEGEPGSAPQGGLKESSPTLTDCTFTGNSAYADGGGMLNSDSSPTLTNCTFTGNSADFGGGGMFNDGSSPALTNCTFSGNAAQYGGGMDNWNDSSPTLTNCTFYGNDALVGGGMRNVSESSLTLTNCTVYGNSALAGGGTYYEELSSLVLVNCILWGNSPDQLLYDGSAPDVTYSDIQDGPTVAGNIDADPLFVDPGNGDLHLGPGSPCIDAGLNTAPYLPDHDFEGDSRIINGDGDGEPVVDMGVDEAQIRAYLPLVLRGY